MSERSFLYVEDDASSRRLVNIIMTTVLGHSITTLENSENFLEKVRALAAIPDAVFLDIQVIPHNGFEMLKMLRGEPGYENVPVIAMTASVMQSDIDRLKEAGFNGLLGKPIRKRLFKDQLEQILAGEPLWIVQ